MNTKNKAPQISDLKDVQNKKNKKTLITLCIVTILVVAVYFFFTFTDILSPDVKLIIMIVFLSILAVTVFAYVFYNRGFTQRHMTIETLPEEWTQEAKETFINDSKTRAEKSKWMFYIIFPLVITIALDYILLYVVPFLMDLFN